MFASLHYLFRGHCLFSSVFTAALGDVPDLR